MATRIKGKTREQIVDLMVDYIKDSYKNMGKATNKELGLNISNWTCGMGRDRKWSFSEIQVGYDSYMIEDKEVTTDQFIRMVNDAIAKSKVRAKVFSEVYGDGYWTPRETHFNKVEIYAAPIKEFIQMQKLIEKYANFTLHETDVYHVRVCGKRSSWSDVGRVDYLCYNKQKCDKVIELLKKKRTSRDNVKVEVKEYFSHGDEGDYKCAIHMESEWYGYRGQKMELTITTPKGKVKVKEIIAPVELYDY